MGLDRRLDFSAPVAGGDGQAGDYHLAGVSELRRVGQCRYHQHLSLLRCRRHQRQVWLVFNPDRSGVFAPGAACTDSRRSAPYTDIPALFGAPGEFRSPCRGLRNSTAELPPFRETRGHAPSNAEPDARVHHWVRWSAVGARFQRLFGAENRKPTIAQWSVFLPRLGRTRRQASPTILSLPGPLWAVNFGGAVALLTY